MTQTHSHTISPRVLKINVGFLLVKGPGFSRMTELDIPEPLRVSDDVVLQWLKGTIKFTRTSEGILAQGQLQCATIEACHRCLEEVQIAFPLEVEEVFATDFQVQSHFYVDDDNAIDLAPLIREERFLSLPSHILCRPDCKGLCVRCGHNLNEGACACDSDEIDPRFAVLLELRQQLEDKHK